MVLQRTLHDRGDTYHFGIDVDTAIALATALGLQASGATLHALLIEIEERITALEERGIPRGLFQFDAVVMPRFFLDAIALREQTATFALDSYTSTAVIIPGTWALDAILLIERLGSLSLDATILVTVARTFNLDAEITPLPEAFQADAFQVSTFD